MSVFAPRQPSTEPQTIEKPKVPVENETAVLRTRLVEDVQKVLQTLADDITPYIEKLDQFNHSNPDQNAKSDWQKVSISARGLLKKFNPTLDRLDPMASEAGAHSQLRSLIHEVSNVLAPLILAFGKQTPDPDEQEMANLKLAPELIRNKFPDSFKQVINELGESKASPLSLQRIINAAQEDVSQELPLRADPKRQIEIVNMVMDSSILIKKPETLRRALHEFIFNAVKAELGRGEGNYVMIDVTKQTDGSINVVITDNGPGLSDKVSNPVLGGASTHDLGRGSGYGVLIAKRQLEETHLSDSVIVSNTPGKKGGVTVTIHIILDAIVPPKAMSNN